jgi:hypothetical protein
MAAKKNPKFRATANPIAAKAATERAFSGAWGTHDNRPPRQRTRSTAKRAAVRSGW